MADEFPIPSAKKLRLSEELPLAPPGSIENEEDIDSFYTDIDSPRKEQPQARLQSSSVAPPLLEETRSKPVFSLPGLGLLSPPVEEPSQQLNGRPENEATQQAATSDQKREVQHNEPEEGKELQEPVAAKLPQAQPENGEVEAPGERESMQTEMNGDSMEMIQELMIDEKEASKLHAAPQDPPQAEQQSQSKQNDSVPSPEDVLLDDLVPTTDPRPDEEHPPERAETGGDDLVHKPIEDGEQVLASELDDAAPVAAPQGGKANGQPEYAYDSSPYESNSDDSSDASSEDDSDDSDEDDYELLNPAEQARRLMEDEGGSDEEGHGKNAASGPIRTINEKSEEVVEIPDIAVTPDMQVEELGTVEAIVDNIVLIKAKVTGEYQVLEAGSLLCLENRTVIGVVAETLGRVQEPLYSVRFTNGDSIRSAGLSQGTKVSYVPLHSTFVFTKALQSVKGSDASNVHDEEVGDDEIEFSDDEAEAEYKRRKKLQRQDRRDARSGTSRGRPYPSAQGRSVQQPDHVDVSSLKYDDNVAEDELYTPLVRPSHLYGPGASSPILTDAHRVGYSRRPRGMRDRGQRGRGMGRGRGERRHWSNGSLQPMHTTPNVSLPATPQFDRPSNSQFPPTPPAQFAANVPSPLTPQFPFAPQGQAYQGQFPLPSLPMAQTPYASPQAMWQSNQGAHQTPRSGQTPTTQQGHETPTSPPYNEAFPPGAFINPAFFAHQFPNQSG